MTRLYIQPSWIDSCADHGEWSGGNDQYRGDKSIEAVPTYINGKPNVKAFSDEAIEARKEKRKTSIPLVDRILPQQRRVRVLTDQLIELEAERKAGMDIYTYSQLRDILVCKRDRAEVLLKKAASLRPNREEIDELGEETSYSSCDVDYSNTPTTPSHWLDDFIVELPDRNCFKNFLKMSCKVVRKAVHYKHKVSSYLNELKAT